MSDKTDLADTLSGNWWGLLLLGLLAIMFGLLALLSPLGAAAVLTLWLGALAIAEGIVLLAGTIRDALALYVRRIVREIGALVAVLGGLDLLVFTAGVGEHSPEIRHRVCKALGFLSLRLDPGANKVNTPVVSAADSTVVVGVEPTNEEWVAARHAQSLYRLGIET